MTKAEFLSKLKEALENDLDQRTVQDNMDYYASYINEEIAKGRSEAEVIDELGDPWVIAHSVIEMAENAGEASGNGEYSYGDGGRANQSAGREKTDYQGTNIHTYSADTFGKKLLLIIGIIGIVMLVFTVVGGVVSFLSPIVMPIIIIAILVRFFRRIR